MHPASKISIEVTIIRANGTEEILGAVGSFIKEEHNDNSSYEPDKE